MKPIVWNYGGGKQSVAIGVLIAQGKLPTPERALIVNTGREASSTWRYLTEHMQPLLDTVGLTVEIVPHSYSLVDLYDKKGGVLIPGWTKGGEGQSRTFCSGEWKRDAAYRWLREPERGYGWTICTHKDGWFVRCFELPDEGLKWRHSTIVRPLLAEAVCLSASAALRESEIAKRKCGLAAIGSKE